MTHESAGGTGGAARAAHNARKAPCALPIVCCNRLYVATSAGARTFLAAHWTVHTPCSIYAAGTKRGRTPPPRRGAGATARTCRSERQWKHSCRCGAQNSAAMILSDLIRSDRIGSDPILSDLIRFDLIRSDLIVSDLGRSNPIESDPIRSCTLRIRRQCARRNLRLLVHVRACRLGVHSHPEKELSERQMVPHPAS